VAESFFATMKTELIDRRSWASVLQVHRASFDFIEVFSTTSGCTPRWVLHVREVEVAMVHRHEAVHAA
jgi:hypothetical protein